MGLPAVLLLVLTTCVLLILRLQCIHIRSLSTQKGFDLVQGLKGKWKELHLKPNGQFLSIQLEQLNVSDQQVRANLANSFSLIFCHFHVCVVCHVYLFPFVYLSYISTLIHDFSLRVCVCGRILTNIFLFATSQQRGGGGPEGSSSLYRCRRHQSKFL